VTYTGRCGWRASTTRYTRRSAVTYRGRKVAGLTQRKNADGSVVFDARPRVHGVLARKTLSATTVAAAVAELEAFKSELRARKPEARNGVTFAQAFDLYVERLKQENRSPASVVNAQFRFKHLTSIHDRPLASLTRGDVADLIRSWRRSGAAGASIRSYWTLGSIVFNLAIEHEFDGLTVNPFTSAKKLLPPARKGARREVTPEVAHLLLDTATPRQKPLVALLALQGLRISEALGAVWGDVDLDQGVLAVTHQLGSDGQRKSLKTADSERTLTLDPRTVEILRAHKVRQLERGHHGPDTYILCTASGRPLMRRQAHRALQGVAKRAKVIGPGESFRPHDLRSAFVVAALLAGDAPNLVQKMVGHSTPQMTMGLYGKVKGKEAVGTSAFAQPEADVVQIERRAAHA
jgi:integrase